MAFSLGFLLGLMLVIMTFLTIVALPLLSALSLTVRRLNGRRTPRQELEGPLVGITQPTIPNRWATGRPPLALINHPNGMIPKEERSFIED